MRNLDNSFSIFPKALQIHEKRAAVLGSNFAHRNTPNYKAKDWDFKEILNNYANSLQGKVHSTSNLDAHAGNLKYRASLQPSIDGNTVDGQIEQTQFTENTIRYLASLNFLTSRIQGLLYAIKGGR